LAGKKRAWFTKGYGRESKNQMAEKNIHFFFGEKRENWKSPTACREGGHKRSFPIGKTQPMEKKTRIAKQGRETQGEKGGG